MVWSGEGGRGSGGSCRVDIRAEGVACGDCVGLVGEMGLKYVVDGVVDRRGGMPV